MDHSRKIYFAGALFDHKEIAGNFLLAEAITTYSEGRYQILLPQDIEQPSMRSIDIRDHDLLQVIQSDGALFNFDGTDLDSGTVVEFMVAKMLDLPTVLLRTDLRRSGDQGEGADQWNLMCSGYPRSTTLLINGMERYHKTLDRTARQPLAPYYHSIASEVTEALDTAFSTPSRLAASFDRLRTIYAWALEFPGIQTQHASVLDIEQLVTRRLASYGRTS